MDPGSVILDSIQDRGDELLKNTGQRLSCFWVRLHSVIPAEAEPAPDSIRGPGQARSGESMFVGTRRRKTIRKFPTPRPPA